MTTRSTKGDGKPAADRGMPGAGLSRRRTGKAPPDRPTFQPYWGKPDVRNDRGGSWKRDHGGNVNPPRNRKGGDGNPPSKVRAPVPYPTGSPGVRFPRATRPYADGVFLSIV